MLLIMTCAARINSVSFAIISKVSSESISDKLKLPQVSIPQNQKKSLYNLGSKNKNLF